ncbi:hypothetical protein F5051DRAFT_432949 [Lentinula edodes]|nr:hypothetical protein F5051DRAFT_432949 [Lentinula edodes]
MLMTFFLLGPFALLAVQLLFPEVNIPVFPTQDNYYMILDSSSFPSALFSNTVRSLEDRLSNFPVRLPLERSKKYCRLFTQLVFECMTEYHQLRVMPHHFPVPVVFMHPSSSKFHRIEFVGSTTGRAIIYDVIDTLTSSPLISYPYEYFVGTYPSPSTGKHALVVSGSHAEPWLDPSQPRRTTLLQTCSLSSSLQSTKLFIKRHQYYVYYTCILV